MPIYHTRFILRNEFDDNLSTTLFLSGLCNHVYDLTLQLVLIDLVSTALCLQNLIKNLLPNHTMSEVQGDLSMISELYLERKYRALDDTHLLIFELCLYGWFERDMAAP